MAWLHLCIAGLLEILWAISLKHTEGFSNLRWSVVTVVGMTASFYFLAQALKTIPVGTAYAIWTGIGAAGTAILGIMTTRSISDVAPDDRGSLSSVRSSPWHGFTYASLGF